MIQITTKKKITNPAPSALAAGWLFHYCARAWNLAVSLLDKLLWIFCRLMEIHGMKVNFFAIMMVTVFDVSLDETGGGGGDRDCYGDINVWACGCQGTYWESSKGLL